MECKHVLNLREFAKAYYIGSKCKKCGKRIRIQLTKHLFSILVVVLSFISMDTVYKHFHSDFIKVFLSLIIPLGILHIYVIICYKKQWYRIKIVEEGTKNDQGDIINNDRKP